MKQPYEVEDYEVECRASPEVAKCLGAVIADAQLIDDDLRLTLVDGRVIVIRDDKRMCCEERHMSTDDDPKVLIGHKLLRIDLKRVTGVEDTEARWDEKSHFEEAFVEIGTDAGFVTLVCHNVHGGNYSGFELSAFVDSGSAAARSFSC